MLQYDVHPFVGLSFGPITFLICVLGGLGNFVGGFVAAFVFAEIISLGGLFSDLEWGYVLAFAFFIVMMFIRPGGPAGEALSDRGDATCGRIALGDRRRGAGRAAVRAIAIPITLHIHRADPDLVVRLHLLVDDGPLRPGLARPWRLHGRRRLRRRRCCGTISASRRGSASRSPWSAPARWRVIVAYPCFRFRITGHYFVLVTLALSGIVLQVITATRD